MSMEHPHAVELSKYTHSFISVDEVALQLDVLVAAGTGLASVDFFKRKLSKKNSLLELAVDHGEPGTVAGLCLPCQYTHTVALKV